ncbi:hypothetical protein ABFX02_04G120700 [Erythranthe guttata]
MFALSDYIQPNNALSSFGNNNNKNNNNNNNNNNNKHIPNPIPMNKKRKSSSKQTSSPNSAHSKKQKKKIEEEEEKKGYIHVRARRGQATDRHSLAERVRRERISERMKLLQSLVPACHKVTGKALMLDEIIHYVQSLQNQVEFLSMKLASVNPLFYDFGMDLESSFMVGHIQQNLTPLPSMKECIMDNSVNSLLLQQPQINPLNHAVPQGHRQVLWEEEDQRQRIINQTENLNTFYSLH